MLLSIDLLNKLCIVACRKGLTHTLIATNSWESYDCQSICFPLTKSMRATHRALFGSCSMCIATFAWCFIKQVTICVNLRYKNLIGQYIPFAWCEQYMLLLSFNLYIICYYYWFQVKLPWVNRIWKWMLFFSRINICEKFVRSFKNRAKSQANTHISQKASKH